MADFERYFELSPSHLLLVRPIFLVHLVVSIVMECMRLYNATPLMQLVGAGIGSNGVTDHWMQN